MTASSPSARLRARTLIRNELGIWRSLFFMVVRRVPGRGPGVQAFPYAKDDDGLRLRQGATTDIRIPWEAVASVTARRGRVPTRERLHIEQSDDGPILNVAAMKRTRVEIALVRPTPVELPNGVEEVTRVRLYADNPTAFIAAVRERRG